MARKPASKAAPAPPKKIKAPSSKTKLPPLSAEQAALDAATDIPPGADTSPEETTTTGVFKTGGSAASGEAGKAEESVVQEEVFKAEESVVQEEVFKAEESVVQADIGQELEGSKTQEIFQDRLLFEIEVDAAREILDQEDLQKEAWEQARHEERPKLPPDESIPSLPAQEGGDQKETEGQGMMTIPNLPAFDLQRAVEAALAREIEKTQTLAKATEIFSEAFLTAQKILWESPTQAELPEAARTEEEKNAVEGESTTRAVDEGGGGTHNTAPFQPAPTALESANLSSNDGWEKPVTVQTTPNGRSLETTALQSTHEETKALDASREPEISIVIPVYNEEGIITSSVEDVVKSLTEIGWSYEILLAENGSRDATPQLAANLCERFPSVRLIRTGEPNYGKALRQGILQARGTYVICDEIDLCDTRFYRNAVALLRQGGADLVVGSKLLGASKDERGWLRTTASQILNGMLRTLVGFQGTDTHGLKAFRREALLKVVEACVVDKDLFSSELVIRAERAVRVREIPLQIEEKRKPSINLFKRVPNVLKNMARLVWIFRFQEKNKR